MPQTFRPSAATYLGLPLQASVMVFLVGFMGFVAFCVGLMALGEPGQEKAKWIGVVTSVLLLPFGLRSVWRDSRPKSLVLDDGFVQLGDVRVPAGEVTKVEVTSFAASDDTQVWSVEILHAKGKLVFSPLGSNEACADAVRAHCGLGS